MFGAGASSRRHARRRFESSAWMAALVAILAVTMLVVAPVSADPIGPGDIGGGGGIDLGPQPVPKWSMPDRYHLSPSVGVPDGTPPDPLGQEWQDYIRPPQGWVLNVDGCASYDFGGGSIVEWEWTLATPDGSVVGTIARSPNCTGSFEGLELGPYDLTLKVWASSGLANSTTRHMEVRDLVIAVAGDSLASGEGNPEEPGELDTDTNVISRWVDPDCDRSSNSGHARAARQIEQDDPERGRSVVRRSCGRRSPAPARVAAHRD